MRIAVVGAGAIGSLFGALLSQAADAVLVSRNAAYVAAVREHGLRLIDGEIGQDLRLPVYSPEEVPGLADLVLVTTKAYDTASVAPLAAAIVDPDGLVVTIQNGVGNYETLAARCGADRTAAGVTSNGALMERPGVVRHTGAGLTMLAGPAPLGRRLEAVADVFQRVGIATTVGDDVDGMLWGKLLVNVGLNALSALLRVPNGALAEVEPARALMLAAVAEAEAVAHCRGTRLPPGDPRTRVVEVARATAVNQSSMLRDVLRGSRTEVGAINGAVVREGERLGVPTPINALLLALIEATEAAYTRRIDAVGLRPVAVVSSRAK